MFCLQCGKELDNNAKFCPYCGAVVAANTPQFAPAADPASALSGNPGTGRPGFDQDPRRAKIRGRSMVLIGAVAAVVAVVVLAVALIAGGLFSGDKGTVERALVKSVSAYADAAKDVGLPDLTGLVNSQKFSQSVEIALEDVNLNYYYFDASVLEGIGIRYSANYDLPGEKLSVLATPFYGSADLLTAELVMDGSRIYINSPELTGATYYGLDTMTLGKDLQKMGADKDEVGDLSFNIFQLVKKIQEITEMDSGSRKAIEEAGKELFKAIEVTKGGKETVRVNGSSVDCTSYTVLIPKSAMKDCLKAVKSAVSDSVDYRKDLIGLFSSLGLPDEAMDEIKDALSDADLKQSVRTVFSSLEDMVNKLGDVELQMYISGGYVMGVTYSHRIEGTRVKLALYLGGGKNYADDLSLTLRADDYADTEITLTSHGDHGAKSGTFTDETVLEISEYGYTTEISSEISYAPKKNQNNFSWRIDFDGGRIEMEGQLATGKNSMELHLNELELRSGNMSVALRMDYSIGSYQSIPSVKSPVMLSSLNEDKLLDIVDDIRDNAEDWAYDLLDEIPELRYIF